MIDVTQEGGGGWNFFDTRYKGVGKTAFVTEGFLGSVKGQICVKSFKYDP